MPRGCSSEEKVEVIPVGMNHLSADRVDVDEKAAVYPTPVRLHGDCNIWLAEQGSLDYRFARQLKMDVAQPWSPVYSDVTLAVFLWHEDLQNQNGDFCHELLRHEVASRRDSVLGRQIFSRRSSTS